MSVLFKNVFARYYIAVTSWLGIYTIPTRFLRIQNPRRLCHLEVLFGFCTSAGSRGGLIYMAVSVKEMERTAEGQGEMHVGCSWCVSTSFSSAARKLNCYKPPERRHAFHSRASIPGNGPACRPAGEETLRVSYSLVERASGWCRSMLGLHWRFRRFASGALQSPTQNQSTMLLTTRFYCAPSHMKRWR